MNGFIQTGGAGETKSKLGMAPDMHQIGRLWAANGLKPPQSPAY